MKKKLIALFLMISVTASLAACSDPAANTASGGSASAAVSSKVQEIAETASASAETTSAASTPEQSTIETSAEAATAATADDGSEKLPVKMLLVPKFEQGEMSGDDIGEAQLFYEYYLMGSKIYKLANGFDFYYNKDNGVAMGLTHAGKDNTVMFITAALADSRFDFSDAYILCVGCAGSAYGNVTMGTVAIIQDAVDFDLLYESTGLDENGDVKFNWYDNPDTRNNAHKTLNKELVDKAYEMTKDIPMRTTAITQRTMERNFPGEEWATQAPTVIKGTSVSADTYWKGENEHKKAVELAEYYECEYPYAITEMEDSSCAVAVDSFGMLDRLIILRASVNLDVFLDGATPESTWGTAEKYEDAVLEENEENLDIFVPAMENLFDVGSVIGDAILDGSINE